MTMGQKWRRGEGFEPPDGLTHRNQQAGCCLTNGDLSQEGGLLIETARKGAEFDGFAPLRNVARSQVCVFVRIDWVRLQLNY
jgi:hypothetical protein